MLFYFMYTIFPLGVLYPEHLQVTFDFVINACSLDSIRPGLVQGCKAPNVVAKTCLITSSESGLPHWIWSVRLKSAPAGTWTHDRTIGPSQATPSLLIGVVLSPSTGMWGRLYQHRHANILGHTVVQTACKYDFHFEIDRMFVRGQPYCEDQEQLCTTWQKNLRSAPF